MLRLPPDTVFAKHQKLLSKASQLIFTPVRKLPTQIGFETQSKNLMLEPNLSPC
jgi:hypothetical protein